MPRSPLTLFTLVAFTIILDKSRCESVLLKASFPLRRTSSATCLGRDILQRNFSGVAARRTMSNNDPVSLWIEELRQADQIAARQIWQHFAARLHQMAGHQLRARTKRVYDEDDALQSMFESVCRGLAEGRFPDLRDRDSLWQLMLVITGHKIANRHRYDRQQRRDERRTLTDSIFSDIPFEESRQASGGLISREPTPEFVAEFQETSERLFATLNDPELKEIAILRVEGYGDSEIAERLNCSRRTVQRRLTMIRRHWESLDLPNE